MSAMSPPEKNAPASLNCRALEQRFAQTFGFGALISVGGRYASFQLTACVRTDCYNGNVTPCVNAPIQNNPNASSIGAKHFMRACGARVAKETGPETQPGLAKPVVENRMGSTGIRASVRIIKITKTTKT